MLGDNLIISDNKQVCISWKIQPCLSTVSLLFLAMEKVTVEKKSYVPITQVQTSSPTTQLTGCRKRNF